MDEQHSTVMTLLPVAIDCSLKLTCNWQNAKNHRNTPGLMVRVQ